MLIALAFPSSSLLLLFIVEPKTRIFHFRSWDLISGLAQILSDFISGLAQILSKFSTPPAPKVMEDAGVGGVGQDEEDLAGEVGYLASCLQVRIGRKPQNLLK